MSHHPSHRVGKTLRPGLGLGSNGSSTVATAAATSTSQPAADVYVDTMRSLQVAFVESLPFHKYATEAEQETSKPKERVKRLTKEIGSLKVDLPLNESSSVFVRVEETNICLWRVLITGPSDTPYANGCFAFDVYFPQQYPNVPPKVNLKTTGMQCCASDVLGTLRLLVSGGGKVRFNPNLYNCGKVCLSLLGTWSGSKDEQWSYASSMLQVLVSIQSLILIPKPYFNEPGYETSMNTDSGKRKSDAYNDNIQLVSRLANVQ